MTGTPNAHPASHGADWPVLPFTAWEETRATLQLWTQVVGKVRLALAPAVNHWWHVPLYVTCRGLTTSPMPYGARMVQIDLDFQSHRLLIQASDGAVDGFALVPMTVADFHAEVMGRLKALGLDVHIWPMPVEIVDPIPFDADTVHAAYDAEHANRLWRALVQADRLLTRFRAPYLGKVSPVHFFWGSFDMAVTRFSGRAAPRHPGVPNLADHVTRSAYSHEVSSAGFWPGGPGLARPIFYAYAYPTPEGLAAARIRPAEASFDGAMGEFVLPYDAVRTAPEPDTALLDFLQSTYAASADLLGWDRPALEAAEGTA